MTATAYRTVRATIDSPLFTRYGAPNTLPVRHTPTGKPYAIGERKCSRCGGAGRSDRWAHTGYTCFDCGGEGTRGTEEIKLYTPAELDTLNARKAKADATRQAKAAARAAADEAEAATRFLAFTAANLELIAAAQPYMETDSFIGDVMRKALARAQITDAQAAAVAAAIARNQAREAARAASRHVGKIGERRDFNVTVERVYTMPRPKFGAPWITEVFAIVTMRDTDGNAIISKSASFIPSKGESFTMRATVKEFGDHNGEAQTIVQRIKREESPE